ncbi:DUF115 domain-containing protein [Danxiaibacter flavus]|uniref:DUF115 domain-containing protein n=1 Tax=Danxiaibacter flavus TaxID=3049108 RepID=A0ABV3ZCC5_9BACT|nr:DUF115 domain-containing protein [Chitinophagaceae bacterium DXS]
MDNTFLEDSPILNTPAKLNPYKEARWLFVNRFKWDLRPVAWASRKKLRKLQDKYAGKKAVIMCNGPSLNKVDYDKLKNVFTFGLNKINLLFNRTDFRPSAIAVVNGHVMEQNAAFYNETDIPLFLDTCGLKYVRFRENVHFMHATDTAKFSRDISGSIWKGGTVTFAAMQLAYHMGFTKVALVGCDHYFNAVGAANQLAVSNGKDDSHFDPNYFSGGMKWQLPDIAASEYSYSLAREMYTASDRLLLNATEGGHLTLLPRIDLDTFLDDKF